jgi:GT2 family glycosyltransferase
MPVYDTPEVLLRKAFDSVLAQWYGHWELCAVDDGSTAPWVPGVLEEYSRRDSRVTVVTHPHNRHIAAASNSGLAATNGSFVAALDHDDELAPQALAFVALTIGAHPDAGLLYSDEDHLDEDGTRRDPYFKPDFDPVLLLAQNYVAHLCVMRREVVDAVGGYREGFDGSQDWDLVLRVVERLRPEQIVHVPRVLYHWRAHQGSTARDTSTKDYAIDAGRRSVAEHLRRIGVEASVRTTAPTGFTRVTWEAESPTVSVVMPAITGDSLIQSVDGVLARTRRRDVELQVVLCGEEAPVVRDFLDQHRGQLSVLLVDGGDEPRASRRARMFAAGASASEADVVCFLHDDVEVLADGWLDELTGLLGVPGVGAVGAKLLAPGGSVRHFGYRLAPSGEVVEPLVGRDRLDAGYFGRAGLIGSSVAVSGAAMAVRRDVYAQVGGHRAHDSDALVDVDLCLRIRDAGWRCAVNPYAELVHHECDSPPDPAAIVAGWHGEDPTWNPNLSAAGNGELAWPPRIAWPASVRPNKE